MENAAPGGRPERETKPNLIYIAVKAPVGTSEVLMALRDYEPIKGLRFTFEKRRSFILLFSVNTENGFQAVDLAKKRLKEKELDGLKGLSVDIY